MLIPWLINYQQLKSLKPLFVYWWNRMSKDFETGALKASISISYCKNSELKQLDCEIETLSLKTP
jgi:hypothetical protein